ncbi:MAG: putative toxin-antitoxin system toxin component, PIN family [Deltaproteobacteria bacterium]|nr:putative toxin-antitoxin system toxin component, PIN family [Deltaproteobacteria bacterium]
MNPVLSRGMLRVVIDTNVIISALNFGGNPKAVLELARKRHIRNITSPFIINEIERVLTRKFGWQMEVTREVINDLKDFSHVVTPPETIAVIKNLSDNRILEYAVAGEVDYLISVEQNRSAAGGTPLAESIC